jgi:glyoxylase I family protein
MLSLQGIHHVAIICSDFLASKKFYTEILGFRIVAEHYRAERKSFKLDLSLNDQYCIELFSFPEAPPRLSHPEGRGLRHLAFAVGDLDAAINHLKAKGVAAEPVRIDEYTGKRFTFFTDPDQLPLELYEQ